jgi:hypothetical protein
MKFSIMNLSLVLCLMASSSFAKTTRTLPTYPATEDTPSEEVISSAPGYQGQQVAPQMNSAQESDAIPPPAPMNEPKAVSLAPTPPAPPARTYAPLPTTNSKTFSTSSPTRFDAVPSAQAEPLLRRLRLTEELISKYGRAYDYRALTVTELQTILAQLEAQAAQAAQFRSRVNTRTEIKRTIEDAPTASATAVPMNDTSSSLGSEAPESIRTN